MLREVCGEGFELLADGEVAYRCGCSDARARTAVSALGRDGVLEVLATDKEAVITCEFCRSRYVVDEDALREIARRLGEGEAAGERGCGRFRSLVGPDARPPLPEDRHSDLEEEATAAPRRAAGGQRLAALRRSPRSRAAAPRPLARPGQVPQAPPAEGRLAAGEQPLGMGVADGFAMDRLAAPVKLRRAPKKAVREIGWAAFGEVARGLARDRRTVQPDVVIGVAKGGVFVGSALAAALGVDFFPVRIEKRRRDAAPLTEPVEFPDLSRKKVLVVDDAAASGATLAKARAVAREGRRAQVRTAVLVVRPDGARPDFSFIETDELVLFGWDYQLDGEAPGGVDPAGIV